MIKYEHLQKHVERHFKGAHLYQNDLIDAAITTIVMSICVATVFGGLSCSTCDVHICADLLMAADFFFLAQFPDHGTSLSWHETESDLNLTESHPRMTVYPGWVHVSKRIASVVTLFGLSAAVGVSTWVILFNSAKISGVDPGLVRETAKHFKHAPLLYKKSYANMVWLALLWTTWVLVLGSTIVLWIAAVQDQKNDRERRRLKDLAPETSTVANAAPATLMTAPEMVKQDSDKDKDSEGEGEQIALPVVYSSRTIQRAESSDRNISMVV